MLFVQVMVTTYDSFKQELLRIRWHAAVLDEVHLIKNCKTARWKAASQLRTVHRYACPAGRPDSYQQQFSRNSCNEG